MRGVDRPLISHGQPKRVDRPVARLSGTTRGEVHPVRENAYNSCQGFLDQHHRRQLSRPSRVGAAVLHRSTAVAVLYGLLWLLLSLFVVLSVGSYEA